MPAGYLADRGKRTHIIALVLLSWGLISALNSLVQNLAQFIAIRAAFGIGETIDNPASQSLLADYYPTERRGRAYAAQRAAPLVGTAIGTGIGGVVSATFGWRWAFLIVGVPGSVIASAVLATARARAQGQRRDHARRLARRPRRRPRAAARAHAASAHGRHRRRHRRADRHRILGARVLRAPHFAHVGPGVGRRRWADPRRCVARHAVRWLGP